MARKPKGEEIGGIRARDKGKEPGEIIEYRVYKLKKKDGTGFYKTMEFFKPFKGKDKETGEDFWGKSFEFYYGAREIDTLMEYLQELKRKLEPSGGQASRQVVNREEGPEF